MAGAQEQEPSLTIGDYVNVSILSEAMTQHR